MKINQPFIATVGSKGESHVCVYSEFRMTYSKVFRIKHDRYGFNILKEMYNRF